LCQNWEITLKKVDWYFDFISPFAYLQFSQFKRFENDLSITIHPVVFGALLKHWGQLGPAEIVPKRIFTYRFFKWKADRLGIEYTMPPSHPFNPLPALLSCIAGNSTYEVTKEIFDIIYKQGEQPDQKEGREKLETLLNKYPSEYSELDESALKKILRTNTSRAIENGVFGVPTFVVDQQIFWGGDSSDMMLDFIKNPELFSSEEMQRVSSMPMGLIRNKP
jgi:2-hydroxychromene-2-carboxylate isomerase|tara:strand:+ start:314 stop:976 length:663 start_codon:yes stop_codon:yes gene_type:complete